MDKKGYDSGFRCRGICQICNDRISCYQYKMDCTGKGSMRIPFSKAYSKEVSVRTSFRLGIEDIQEWISECPNPEDLIHLAGYARDCAEKLLR